MASLFRKKYVRQTIFIIGFLLFLFSLFEWTGDERLLNRGEIAGTEQLSSKIVSEKTIIKKAEVLCCINQPGSANQQFKSYILSYTSFSHSLPVKRFLFIRSLRI